MTVVNRTIHSTDSRTRACHAGMRESCREVRAGVRLPNERKHDIDIERQVHQAPSDQRLSAQAQASGGIRPHHMKQNISVLKSFRSP